MSYNSETLRSPSARIGKPTLAACVSLISLIHSLCDSALSTDNAIVFTLRFSNSPASFAVKPSSVVQTGVKSAGCENSTPQLSPSQSWNLMRPTLDSCSKSGAISPRRRLILQLLDCIRTFRASIRPRRAAKVQHTGGTVNNEPTSRHYFMRFCNFHRFIGNFAGQINSILSELCSTVPQGWSF